MKKKTGRVQEVVNSDLDKNIVCFGDLIVIKHLKTGVRLSSEIGSKTVSQVSLMEGNAKQKWTVRVGEEDHFADGNPIHDNQILILENKSNNKNLVSGMHTNNAVRCVETLDAKENKWKLILNVFSESRSYHLKEGSIFRLMHISSQTYMSIRLQSKDDIVTSKNGDSDDTLWVVETISAKFQFDKDLY